MGKMITTRAKKELWLVNTKDFRGMSIERMMIELAFALPEKSRVLKSKTKREVGLWFLGNDEWHVAAGGHYAVSLGEWGGDFGAQGHTAEEAITACLQKIVEARQ